MPVASTDTYDVAVLGSGPGGYVAAIRAGQLGLKTAIIERDPFLGGTCLHRGCIPTKALLHTADLLDEIRHAGTFGITGAGDPRVDMAQLHARKDKVVNQLAQGVRGLLRRQKVALVQGRGTLAGQDAIAVVQDGKETATVRARNLVLATGSEVRDLPGLPTDGKVVLSSDHILKLPMVPASLLVVGAGAVGVEFASIFLRFGSRVTLVEMLDRLVPIEDEDVSRELERAFKKQGMDCRPGTVVTALAVKDGRAEAKLKGKDGKESTETFDRVLVAVGRKPNTAGNGFAEHGVKLTKETVDVDDRFRTSVPGIYAIGDIIKGPWLAHAASHEGLHVMHEIAGRPLAEKMDFRRVPNATYCFPEVASIGLTETQARERGYDVVVSKFPFVGIGKALILGQIEGFVKIVAEKKYEEVLGVHVIGPKATELISPASVALAHEATGESLASAVQAHPTLSEAIGEAAHGIYGMAIHF
jgi:dihydrolipoamide dehydrogenase